jgi:PAS domain S-box-containing protein
LARLLDKGLDELAANAHASFSARIPAIIAVGLIALNFLPAPVCAVWFGAEMALETWSWFATRAQYRGRPISDARRLQYLATLVGGATGWCVLGGLFWTSGTAGGAVSAVITWLAVLIFAQVNAYQSRLGYLVVGAAPALGMLITTLVAPNPAVNNAGAVWFMMLVCVAFAATGARQTTQARRRFDQATADLRASEQSYRLLADNVNDVISLTSVDHQRLYLSPSIERVLGFTVDMLMSTPNYTYMYPDDIEAMKTFVDTVTVESGGKTTQYRVYRADGSVVWAETTFTRLSDGSGRLLGVSRDISHRKQLEDELRDALARSEAAAAAKADFLANMTHELRTPLNAILGFSGVLRTSTLLTPQDARRVELIHDASATLLGVVGDVLDYSKLEAGAFELDPQPFDPAATTHSAAAMIGDQAAAKGLALVAEIDEAMPLVVGDAPRLRQVLLNFLSNAVKFTRDGGVEVVCAHRIEADRCHLRWEVRDTGIGIPDDQADAVFMRFTQADASVSRQFGGTGLGLAISKQIIEAMGGRIGVASLIGQGSTFWFEIAVPVAAEAAPALADARAGAALDRRLNLLVVEDNAVNRELITTLLSPFDIAVDTANDGAEALEAVTRAQYDLILMDVQMPVMDGLTATRRIRAMRPSAGRGVPIVAMTANVLPEQIARCREAGMDDHLGKPINPARLLETLHRWTQADGDPAEARVVMLDPAE